MLTNSKVSHGSVSRSLQPAVTHSAVVQHATWTFYKQIGIVPNWNMLIGSINHEQATIVTTTTGLDSRHYLKHARTDTMQWASTYEPQGLNSLCYTRTRLEIRMNENNFCRNPRLCIVELNNIVCSFVMEWYCGYNQTISHFKAV